MRIKLLWQTFKANWHTVFGVLLLAFMCAHIPGVSLINFGDDALNWYTKHLDKSNWVIVSAVLVVLFLALSHMIGGFSVIWEYLKHPKKTLIFVKEMKYFETTLWFLNFFVAVPILTIGLITHITVACILSGHDITTVQFIREQFQSQTYWNMMVLLLGALIFHMMCGTKSIIIKYNILEKYQTLIFYGLFVLGLGLFALGLNNLFLLQ